MPLGITSPPPEDIAAAPAHLVVGAVGLTGDDRDRDTVMAKLTAAVVDCTDAVAAMLGHGVILHRAGIFADAAKLAADEHGPLPVELAVDITAAPESATRMSFLTHGMQRYGREELYVTCPIEGTGALSFVYAIARWMLADPTVRLPTGDTVGRTAEEKLPVQRVPSPTGEGPKVIRLDLPRVPDSRRLLEPRPGQDSFGVLRAAPLSGAALTTQRVLPRRRDTPGLSTPRHRSQRRPAYRMAGAGTYSAAVSIERRVEPGEVGLDAAQLARIDRHFAQYVDDGRLAGWHIVVTRRGEVAHSTTYGVRMSPVALQWTS